MLANIDSVPNFSDNKRKRNRPEKVSSHKYQYFCDQSSYTLYSSNFRMILFYHALRKTLDKKIEYIEEPLLLPLLLYDGFVKQVNVYFLNKTIAR
jgi:hypothetical protein